MIEMVKLILGDGVITSDIIEGEPATQIRMPKNDRFTVGWSSR